MNPQLLHTIAELSMIKVGEQRREILQPLIDYIWQRHTAIKTVSLNFICTHNSRRSHLSQVWAQTAAAYYGIQRVACYSGGTQATALFPKVVDTLIHQGFRINTVSMGKNPVYAIKFGHNDLPVLGFSKKYDDVFNPAADFAAIMTCSHAEDNCPFIPGAEKRIPVTYEDPKSSDGTDEQTSVYLERSLQIATEMFYVFSKIQK